MSWRTRGHGKDARHFMAHPKRTLYGAPADETLAREVHSSSVPDARASSGQVLRDFRDAKTAERRKELWRAANEEANRLFVGSHNFNNGSGARRRLAEESDIWRKAADSMHSELVKEGAFEGGRR